MKRSGDSRRIWDQRQPSPPGYAKRESIEQGTSPIDTRLQEFLSRDDSVFIESVAADIETHLRSLDCRVSGYAILTGDDCWVDHLVAAYDTGEGRSMAERLFGERFDVHSWQMCPTTFAQAQVQLEQLNNQFRSLHPQNDAAPEIDEYEASHVTRLHQSIICGFKLANTRCSQIAGFSTFKVFCIPDSDLDVDLHASRELNSWLVHSLYRVWR